MPNHVYNELVVLCKDRSSLDAFVSQHTTTENGFDFNTIRKQPDGLGNQTKDENGNFKMPDWWTWSIENWGTKWNAYDCSIEEPNVLEFITLDGSQEIYHRLRIDFTTAWNEPLCEMMLELSNMHTDCFFGLHYSGEIEYAGWYFFNNGVITDEEEWEQHRDFDDYIAENIAEQIKLQEQMGV